jgi:transposase
VGEDGFALLDALEAPAAPTHLRDLPMMTALRRTWQRHYDRSAGETTDQAHPRGSGVRFKPNHALPPAAEGIESPYDPEARYRQKCDTQWTGYMVHVSETCEPTTPHLLTHVHTTTAAVYEAQCTEPIHQALREKDLAPRQHFVDGAYISAALLATSRDEHGITLRGPTRPVQGWQAHTDGAYDLSQFTVDWEQRQAQCPQGKVSTVWREYVDREGQP